MFLELVKSAEFCYFHVFLFVSVVSLFVAAVSLCGSVVSVFVSVVSDTLTSWMKTWCSMIKYDTSCSDVRRLINVSLYACLAFVLSKQCDQTLFS